MALWRYLRHESRLTAADLQHINTIYILAMGASGHFTVWNMALRYRKNIRPGRIRILGDSCFGTRWEELLVIKAGKLISGIFGTGQSHGLNIGEAAVLSADFRP
jgi:hypothetical protein